MPRPGSLIPKAPIAKLMQQAGGKRISDESVEELVHYLISFGAKIGERALAIAQHAGRKTVQAGDIRIALK